MWYLFLLVVVQVIGEVFPISSSGHQALLSLSWSFFTGSQPPLLPAYVDHFLHGPMIIIVILFFRRRWFNFLMIVQSVMSNLAQPVFVDDGIEPEAPRRSELLLAKKFFMLFYGLVLSTVVTVACYFLRSYLSKKGFLEAELFSVTVGFLCTTIILIATFFLPAGKEQTRTPAQLSVIQHLLLGLLQGIALLPGISRFALVYFATRLIGMRPQVALEYTFLLLFPLMTAAFFVHGLPGYLCYGIPLISKKLWWLLLFVASTIAYLAFGFVYRLIIQEQIGWLALYLIGGPLMLSLFLLMH